jgi:hypothetical protein
VGTVRRELLDHVAVLSEDHLRRLLREYIEYYDAERVHTSLGDSPAGRVAEIKPLDSFKSSVFRGSAAFTIDTRGAKSPDWSHQGRC